MRLELRAARRRPAGPAPRPFRLRRRLHARRCRGRLSRRRRRGSTRSDGSCDASLVVAEERDGEMRYRLLETVRQYAAERLAASGEAGAFGKRHADWALALAEEAEPELTGERQAWWFSTLEAEHDNLRAALAYLGDAGEHERRLRLTIALTRFWYVRGYLAEARLRLRESLGETADGAGPHRRRALTAAAALALLQGDYGEGTMLAEQSLEAARAAGEPKFVANALSNLGAIVLAAGDRRAGGDRARGSGRARPRGRRRADRSARDQQPRRRRADGRRLRPCWAAVRREPRSPASPR